MVGHSVLRGGCTENKRTNAHQRGIETMKTISHSASRLVFVASIVSILYSTAAPGSAATVVLEEFNQPPSVGTSYGISYVPAPSGSAAVFRCSSESRIQYPFETLMPRNGTLEMWIYIQRGYHYGTFLKEPFSEVRSTGKC